MASALPPPRELSIQYAESNRNLAVTFAGICLTLLTFSLFFLLPGVNTDRYSGSLFEITLGALLISMFCFVLASGTYFALLGVGKGYPVLAAQYDRRAFLLMVVGLVILTLEPALVLFTVRLWALGVLGVALWVLALVSLRESTATWNRLDREAPK